ncbi:MAG: TetR/AcrR family transcriptional regulator [Jatrophihabitans sp.]
MDATLAVVTESRRTQGERSAATRLALIEASRPLFSQYGFGSVSTESVVRAAGVTRGAMYHHFADKTELFAAVFEAIEIDLTQRLDVLVQNSGLENLIELMVFGARAWLDVCAEPEVQRLVLIEAPAVLGWERWRGIGQRYGLGLVRSLVDLAISSGDFPQQPSLPLAHVLMGALDEAALYVARSTDPSTARAEVGAVLENLVRGMAGPQRS